MKRVLYLPPRDLTFSTELIRGIGLYCQKYGAWAFEIPGPREWPYHQIIKEWDGDGVITQISGKEAEAALRKTGCAFVNLTAWPGVPTVTNDNQAIGRMGAEHLLSKRFDTLMFLGRKGAIFSKERWKGFDEYLNHAGIKAVLMELEGDRHRIRELLEKRMPEWPLPMALMACDDYLAHEVSICASTLNLGPVGSRLAILGVNNSPQDELNTPPLSSIRLDGKRIGHEAAHLLDDLMSGKTIRNPLQYIQPVGVEERASTVQYGFDDPPISKALERIRIGAMKGMNIEDLLIDLPLSRRTFERRFKQATGLTPWEEIRRVQIEHVKRLLEQTDWSTKRIALSSAFRTPSRLAAVFRQETGETPQAWRKRFRL